MVNHLRTLLLNERPDLTAANEQYIEPTFSPLGLMFDTAAIQSSLINSSFPRGYRNFIATILSNLALNSSVADLLAALDPRLTIDPTLNSVSTLDDNLTINRIAEASSLQVVDQFYSKPAAGIFGGQWTLRKSATNTVEVVDSATATARQVTMTFTSDVSDRQLLDPLNSLAFQFSGVTEVPEFRAVITATNVMQYDAMAALDRLRTNHDALAIFTQGGQSSAMKRLHDIFENSRRPDEVLSAILVAYAHRLSV